MPSPDNLPNQIETDSWKEDPRDFMEIDENGVEVIYPHKAAPPPPNYGMRQGRVRTAWDDMDLGERLTADPSYIDRV